MGFLVFPAFPIAINFLLEQDLHFTCPGRRHRAEDRARDRAGVPGRAGEGPTTTSRGRGPVGGAQSGGPTWPRPLGGGVGLQGQGTICPLARHSVSREVPRFILKFETVFGKLHETPKVP